jgi:2-octaprenyl-6-methoxyphenol hydroxylase
MIDHTNIAVVGGGPVGLVAALSLAKALPNNGITLYAGRRKPAVDGRAAAIVGRSIEVLDALGLGDAFRATGAPLAGIRMIDVTGRLMRAPTTVFRSSDVDLAEFGVSLETADIVRLLMERVEAEPRIGLVAADLSSIAREGDAWQLTDDQGQTASVRFVVAADGQNSLAREAADIPVRRWDYPQTAMTFAVRHTRDHEDISTEFHTAEGPFTLVPAGAGRSTVVWMAKHSTATRIMALDDVAFARAAERTCQSLLGALTLDSPRGAYPMRGLMARRFAASGLALVGETGHAFPPIGAQGLNLGIRDADTLASALAKGLNAGQSLENLDLLSRWDQGRQRDAGLRTAGVDAFNRSLLSDLLPVAALRSAGLAVLGSVSPLRRAVMRAGLG